MFLEQAVFEEDEFVRLSKVTQGCHNISKNLPFIDKFSDSNVLKLCTQIYILVLYCYPFQPTSIELILNTIFERFRSAELGTALYQALSEIALWQSKVEVKQSPGRRQSKLELMLNKNGNKYCEEVTANIESIKLFSLTLVMPMFQMTYDFNGPMENRLPLLLQYLKNTSNEEVIMEVMDQFQELKQGLLKGKQYTAILEDRIESYLYQIQSTTSPRVEVLPPSVSESEDDTMTIQEEIEIWLTRDQQLTETVLYFKEEDNFDMIVKFITDPTSSHLASIWAQKYFTTTSSEDHRAYKRGQPQIDKYNTIRSFKSLSFITNNQNFQQLSKQTPNIFHKLFKLMYDFFTTDQNANLYHVSVLLNFLLHNSPKTSVFYIVDNNLLFSLATQLHNSYIFNVLLQLLNIVADEYQIGELVAEELWKYINEAKLFEYITNLMVNKTVDTYKMDRNQKAEQTLHILAVLQNQINYDKLQVQGNIQQQKKLLTEHLGSLVAGKNPDIFFKTAQNDWHKNESIQENIKISEFDQLDIDGLQTFVQQRKSSGTPTMAHSQVVKQISTIQSKQKITPNFRKSQSSFQNVIQISAISPSTPNLPRLHLTPKWIEKTDPRIYLQTSVSIHNSGAKTNKTEHSDYMSFRVKTIYPSYKNHIRTEFEREQFKFKFVEEMAYGCSHLVNILLNSLLMYNNNFQQITRVSGRIIEIDIMFQSLSDIKMIERVNQLYLYRLFDEQNASSLECADIMNQIYENTYFVSEFYLLKDSLKQLFYTSVDFVCKLVLKANELPVEEIQIQNHSAITLGRLRLALTNTLLHGLSLFEDNQYAPNQRNIFLLLNESVIHILILWFMEYKSSNIYQEKFIRLMSLILSRGPQQMVTMILFKLGLVTSLYSEHEIMVVNQMKNISHVESYFLHVCLMVYVIKLCVKSRKLQQLCFHLEMMESWKILSAIQINQSLKIIAHIELMFTGVQREKPIKQTKPVQNKRSSPKPNYLRQATKRMTLALSPNNILKIDEDSGIKKRYIINISRLTIISPSNFTFQEQKEPRKSLIPSRTASRRQSDVRKSLASPTKSPLRSPCQQPIKN